MRVPSGSSFFVTKYSVGSDHLLTKQCHLLIMQCFSRGLVRAGLCSVIPHTTSSKNTNIQKDVRPVEPIDIKIQIPEGSRSVLVIIYESYSLFK